MPLDLEPIRLRLAVIDRPFWRDACAPEEGDDNPGERAFVQNAPDDIAALLDEVDRVELDLRTTAYDLEYTAEQLAESKAKADCLRSELAQLKADLRSVFGATE